MSDGGATATPTAEELSRESIARIDPSDQLGDVLALPEHLRDALWRVESAIMQDWDTTAGLVVAGMGGSAIGGALARAAMGDHASRPIFVTRAYGLAFDLPSELVELYRRRWNNDLVKWNGEGGWSLPIPATYVIGQDARIALAHVDPDYRDRLEPEAVLARLRTLDARRTG